MSFDPLALACWRVAGLVKSGRVAAVERWASRRASVRVLKGIGVDGGACSSGFSREGGLEYRGEAGIVPTA